MRACLIALGLALSMGPAFADEPVKPGTPGPEASKADIPDPKVFTSDHSFKLRGQTIKYKTTAGETYLRDGKDEPTASIFSVAYIRDGLSDPTTRPVTFIFNGGPGSASLWLHMGAFGPKQVITPSDARGVGAPPYTIQDNQNSLLDVSDLVFIDPVGTGYSRPLGDTKGKEFYGVNEDSESIAEFIRVWLTENGRWNSPKFLAGESYGTTRAAALTEKLQGGWNGIGLNGVILISAILDFQNARFAPGNDSAHIAFFPTEAAIAWYHARPTRRAGTMTLTPLLLTRALCHRHAGPGPDPRLHPDGRTAKRDCRRYERLSRVSAKWIELAKLRVDPTRFRKELLRNEGYTVGRFDGRYKGVDSEGTADTPENDPSGYGMDTAYVAAINDYLTRELKVDFTRPYKVLTGEPGSQWNWSMNEQGWPAYVNVTPWLGKGMRENPDLKVLLASGWYDLATPFFGAEMAMYQNGVVLDRVQFDYYDAGHMMYLKESDGTKLSNDVRAFIETGH